MHGDQPYGEFDKTHWLKNWTVAEEYMEFTHCNLWVPAKEFENDSSSTTTMSNRNGTPVRVFPDAVDNTILYSFRRPRMWLNGRVMVRLHYTGAGESGSDEVVYVKVQISATKEGSAIGSFSGTSAAIEAPNTTGEILISRDFEQSQTSGHGLNTKHTTHDIYYIGIQREASDSADTYGGDNWELIGVEIMYKQFIESTGWKSNGISRWLMKK